MVAAANPKDMVMNELRNELETIQKRIKELGSLIDQGQAEVRRLQQRNNDVTSQVTRIENTFDTVPRPEIRATYNAALDARSRLITVQSQLERFQADRVQLERFKTLLENLLRALEGVSARDIPNLPATGSIGAAQASGLDVQTIIRLVQSQEADRQRLAKQIHDGPAQQLTNFILQAEICRRLFDRNPDRAGEELDNLKTSASATFQKVREFIFELRPMMLDDLGVAPTMRRYLEVFSDKTGIETQFTLLGEERRRLETHTEVVLFRGMQELLNYARDASNATQVNISLDISHNPVRAIIVFNGKTLEESESDLEASKNSSVSLNNLVERVELVGGTVELQTIEGEGNQVEVSLPIND